MKVNLHDSSMNEPSQKHRVNNRRSGTGIEHLIQKYLRILFHSKGLLPPLLLQFVLISSWQIICSAQDVDLIDTGSVAEPFGRPSLFPTPWQIGPTQSIPLGWGTVADPLAFPPIYAPVPVPVDQEMDLKPEKTKTRTIPRRSSAN